MSIGQKMWSLACTPGFFRVCTCHLLFDPTRITFALIQHTFKQIFWETPLSIVQKCCIKYVCLWHAQLGSLWFFQVTHFWLNMTPFRSITRYQHILTKFHEYWAIGFNLESANNALFIILLLLRTLLHLAWSIFLHVSSHQGKHSDPLSQMVDWKQEHHMSVPTLGCLQNVKVFARQRLRQGYCNTSIFLRKQPS